MPTIMPQNELVRKAAAFIAEEQGAGPETGDSSDDAYLETIYETFGREPVDVVDEIRQ